VEDRKTRILLVEDEPQISFIIEKFLSTRPDWEVVCAWNGKEAVEAWRRGEFDIILMDLRLPEMDGFRATELIRAEESMNQEGIPARVPIIALTAQASRGHVKTCFDFGITDFITKPVKMSRLLEIVDKHARASAK
jgi:CheY-like chemotaxis protein